MRFTYDLDTEANDGTYLICYTRFCVTRQLPMKGNKDFCKEFRYALRLPECVHLVSGSTELLKRQSAIRNSQRLEIWGIIIGGSKTVKPPQIGMKSANRT